MSWYHAVAGSTAPLTEAVRKRIGVSRFGVEDVGIIEHPQSFAELMQLGMSLSAIDDESVLQFTALPHGSSRQAKTGAELGQQVLTGLELAVAKEVDRVLSGVDVVAHPDFQGCRKWAATTGWEFPVYYDTDGYSSPHLCLAEAGGVAILECAVATVPGRIGDVLCALGRVLCREALKRPSLDALSLQLEIIGLEMGRLSDRDLEVARTLDDDAVVGWVRERDAEGYDDLCRYYGDEGEAVFVAEQYRDILVAEGLMDRRIDAVHTHSGTGEGTEVLLSEIEAAATACPDSSLRTFALTACRCLEGASVGKLLDCLEPCSDFERMPGEYALLSFGEDIAHASDVYENLNQVSHDGDDFGKLPLKGCSDAIVKLLTRITVSERLVMALSAVLEQDDCLSSDRGDRH